MSGMSTNVRFQLGSKIRSDLGSMLNCMCTFYRMCNEFRGTVLHRHKEMVPNKRLTPPQYQVVAALNERTEMQVLNGH